LIILTGDAMSERMAEILERRKIFQRKRTLGVALYKAGMSYAKAGVMVGACHEQ
jgi:hypothetical protein